MLIKRLYHYAKLMRLHRPIGIYLFLWPTLWGLWIAGQGKPSLVLISVFTLGVVIMRSAGCVINDIADRHFDGHVQRTKDRPLVTGEVSLKEACALFVGLSLLACGLLFFLNLYTILLAPVCLALVITYPFMKRFTYWPQLWLGAACNWGIPMTFAAQLNHIPLTGWLMYLAAIFWSLAYDTFYAMVDRSDDRLIGIKSTALLFGKYDWLAIAVLQFIAFSLLVLTGIAAHLGLWYYLGLFVAAVLVCYQLYLTRARQPEECFKAFLNNQWIGLIIFLGLVLNY